MQEHLKLTPPFILTPLVSALAAGWVLLLPILLTLTRIAGHKRSLATGSTAPYHLLDVALNLQCSTDISLRGRQSDFFIFSKKFIGGARTGSCRTATMEQVAFSKNPSPHVARNHGRNWTGPDERRGVARSG